MLGDREVHDSATVVRKQHEHEQYAAGEGRHREEVHRDQGRDVIFEERSPGL
jgi:hypothetical protein